MQEDIERNPASFSVDQAFYVSLGAFQDTSNYIWSSGPFFAEIMESFILVPLRLRLRFA